MSNFYSYDFINSVYSQFSPSTMHTKNNQLFCFFAKYLTEKLFSIYKIGVPRNWDKNFVLTCMFTIGYMAVFRTDKYGVIPMNCGLSGYNVFYRPAEFVIANPLLSNSGPYPIGRMGEIMHLQPNFGSPFDLVTYYADQMAICAETASTNTFASRLAYLFASGNKRDAESFKSIVDDVTSGDIAVAVAKDLFDETTGNLRMEFFNPDLKNMFIAPEVVELMRNWEYQFDREIGIPTANEQKKARMVVDEVNSNNVETATKAELWLETWRESIDKVKAMFGDAVADLSVEWRHNPLTEQKIDFSVEGGGA